MYLYRLQIKWDYKKYMYVHTCEAVNLKTRNHVVLTSEPENITMDLRFYEECGFLAHNGLHFGARMLQSIGAHIFFNTVNESRNCSDT
jgi:hypothetical protein